MRRLCIENAFVFRITHIENIPWILTNGIHCKNSSTLDPSFREIGNPDLIDKRSKRVVPVGPGGVLSDYVPFYFTPYSPMLYNIKTGYNGMQQTPMSDIAILASSMGKISKEGLGFVFTDRHAYLQTALFSQNMNDLAMIDWKILEARDFRRDPNDPGKIERYQAEALVHGHVPISALLGVACYDPTAETRLNGFLTSAGVSLKIVIQPDWYF